MEERVPKKPKIEAEDAFHLQKEPVSFDFIIKTTEKNQKPDNSEDKPNLFNSRSEPGEATEYRSLPSGESQPDNAQNLQIESESNRVNEGSEPCLAQSHESANERASHSGESQLGYMPIKVFKNLRCDVEDYPNTVSPVWFKMDDMKSIATFNQKFVSNINKMMNEYHFIGWKKSRGDGNCYYRAVIHGFLNELLMPFSKYDQHFYNFITAIWNIDFAWVDFGDYRNRAIEMLSNWYNLRQKGKPIEAFTEFLQQSENSEVDKILVMASKMLTANYLIQNQEKESIAPYLFEGLDKIILEILEEGKEAGEIALLVFPLALGIQVVQYNFFEDIKVFEFPHEPESAAFVVPIISKRGGHYDILCNKQFIEDVQYNFETHEYHFPNHLA